MVHLFFLRRILIIVFAFSFICFYFLSKFDWRKTCLEYVMKISLLLLFYFKWQENGFFIVCVQITLALSAKTARARNWQTKQETFNPNWFLCAAISFVACTASELNTSIDYAVFSSYAAGYLRRPYRAADNRVNTLSQKPYSWGVSSVNSYQL